ncbi:hypothetical protein, partial [Anaerovibrio slackiae]|uniref:hypothetical protein n=1 Tax=Anaerovibrio slackiae TaxID=2652309 RepID=UPI00386A8E46
AKGLAAAKVVEAAPTTRAVVNADTRVFFIKKFLLLQIKNTYLSGMNLEALSQELPCFLCDVLRLHL